MIYLFIGFIIGVAIGWGVNRSTVATNVNTCEYCNNTDICHWCGRCSDRKCNSGCVYCV